ncbi:MAG: DUF2254 family protein [Halobacteriales archaeon]|nr:DUF2254 family protein [Halobacteriales archaeon]
MEIGSIISSLPHFSQDAGWQILSTLAIIQASIFAIVFSVVILGVRLSANRYSPRLADIFKSDNFYRLTVGVFAVSIGFDIGGLYLMEFTERDGRLAILVVAGMLVNVAFGTLYLFVSKVLERTTPEGIVKALDEMLTPQWIRDRAEASNDEPTERDPFVTINSVITSTISESDRESTSLCLRTLGESVATLLRETPRQEFEEDTPLDNSIEDLCVERLPNITYEASDNDLTTIATDDIPDTVQKIGYTAVEEELERVIEHLARGQGTLITGLEFNIEDERIRRNVIRDTRQIVRDAAETQMWNAVTAGNIHLGWRSEGSVIDRREDDLSRTIREYGSLLLLHYPRVIDIAVDSEEEMRDYSPHEWGLLFNSNIDYLESQPVERAIASCYDAMAGLTSALIRFEIREGVPIANWNDVAAGWRDGFENLPKELHSLRQLWYGTILYLQYIEHETESEVMTDFSPIILRHISTDFKENTVNEILEGEVDPTGKIDRIPGEGNPREGGLTYKRPPIPNSETEFKEWLRKRPVY